MRWHADRLIVVEPTKGAVNTAAMRWTPEVSLEDEVSVDTADGGDHGEEHAAAVEGDGCVEAGCRRELGHGPSASKISRCIIHVS